MLDGKRVAILVAEGFEQSEMVEPRKALEGAGAETLIVSPAEDEVQGWNHFDRGERFNVDLPLEEANADDFDALLLPGGVANPDQLRTQPKAVAFVKRFAEPGKPIGGQGPHPDVVAVDREVVVDRGLVSSRKPDDLPAFRRKAFEEIGEGAHAGRRKAAAQARPEARG